MQVKAKIAPFGLRMPDDIKAWVASQATVNMRSQNAEIVMALKEKMDRQAATIKIGIEPGEAYL